MKLILILVAIAMMSQVSMASVLGRFKRDNAVEGFTTMLKIMQTVADATGPIVQKTLEKMPQTEAYAKYKKELEVFLQAFNEYKTKQGLCMEKTMFIVNKYDKMTAEYEKEGASEEAKKVDELLNSFGSEDLEEEITENMEKMEKLSNEKKSNDTEDVTDALEVLALLFKVC